MTSPVTEVSTTPTWRLAVGAILHVDGDDVEEEQEMTAHNPLWPSGTRILVSNRPSLVLGPGCLEGTLLVLLDGEPEPSWAHTAWIVEASAPQSEMLPPARRAGVRGAAVSL